MSATWVSRLARRLGLAQLPADAARRLEGLQAAVAALGSAQARTQAALEKVEKELSRAGREQFKANLLGQKQQEDFQAALEHLRQAEAQRQREWAQLRENLDQARHQERVEVIQTLFPVLDGLGEALESGKRLLEDGAVAQPFPLRQRLGLALRALAGKISSGPDQVSAQAAAAWLEGLGLVQERLLEVLAAEGVRPIETEGQPFDPHWHLAVEAVPATRDIEPHTIVAQTRRGYALGDRALRYAEVVVARAPGQAPNSEEREISA
ncbi:MAG: nucleotide exchange factor GrpE [Candidatus Latescibacteria bacterium]|nr:nucleotide exchange factor GrpE [Candidatus Latescibacterota bacterium]